MSKVNQTSRGVEAPSHQSPSFSFQNPSSLHHPLPFFSFQNPSSLHHPLPWRARAHSPRRRRAYPASPPPSPASAASSSTATRTSSSTRSPVMGLSSASPPSISPPRYWPLTCNFELAIVQLQFQSRYPS
jgi:hypothetical protein